MKTREELMKEAGECARILEVSRSEAERLRVQVYHIEQRLMSIEREVADLEKKDHITPSVSGAAGAGVAPDAVDEPKREPVRAEAPHMQPQSQRIPEKIFVPSVKAEKKDFEKILGKFVVGVMASLLVFISLILFAVVVVPKMTENQKIVVMYLLSLGVTAGGIVGLKKRRHNKGFLALTGCGIGSVYISLFLSRIYFDLFSDTVLYLLLLLWGVGLSLTFRLKTWMFRIIGETGVFVSLLFGVGLCISERAVLKFLFLIIYATLSQIIFLVADRKRESEGIRIMNNLSGSLSVLILSSAMLGMGGGTVEFSSLFLHELILMSGGLGLSVYALMMVNNHKDQTGFRISAGFVLSMGILSLLFLGRVKTLDMDFIHFMGGAFLLFLVIIELLMKSEDLLFSVFKGIMILILSCYLIIDSPIHSLSEEYLFFLIPMMACFLFGVNIREGIARKKDYIVYGVLLGALNMLGVFWLNDYAYFLVGLGSIAVIVAGCRLLKKWNTVVKVIIYGVFLVFMVINTLKISDNLGMVMPGVGVTVCSVLLLINLMVREREIFPGELVTGIVNGMIMLAISLIMLMYYPGETLSHIFACVVALLSYGMNSANLMEKKGTYMGYYVGIKFLVLVFIITASFGARGVGISIIFFVYALLCICLGFFFRYKSLRLTGLVLSMVSVVKMILFDISYRNTLQNALGFLVCGIICFGITFIYNKIKI